MPTQTPTTPTVTPNAVLRSWVKHQGYGIAEFGRRMKYRSNAAQLIIGATPTRRVTDETLGRLLRAFRKEAIPVALKLAEMIDQTTPSAN